jgi:hypothetical protein
MMLKKKKPKRYPLNKLLSHEEKKELAALERARQELARKTLKENLDDNVILGEQKKTKEEK